MINNENIMKTLGQRIREKRKQAGLKVEELAAAVGVAASTLQNYETDMRVPALETIKMLAQCMNASPSYIVGFTDCDDGKYPFPVKKVIQNGSDTLFISASTLDKYNLSLSNLISITVKESLLEPDIMKNSEVLIDTSINKIDLTDIYAIKDDSGNIRCLWGRKEIGKDEYILYANNETHFPARHFSSTDENIEILGRVICVVTWR